jgi:pimeloyl-ACP methyl ester carboxylesterase
MLMAMSSSYLLLNELRVHYLRWNQDGAGQPTVLLHGLASNARIWELLAPLLAESGLEVLAPDQRGHGLTDKPDGDYGFDTFRQDLLAFLDRLSLEHPILVGHSWGGMVALDFAARFPMGPFAPSGLILVDGGLGQLNTGPDTSWERISARLAPPRLAGTPVDEFMARLEEWTRAWRSDERVLPILLANFEITEAETIEPHLSYPHHMQILRAMWEYQTFAQLSRVRCPAMGVVALTGEPHSAEQASWLAHKQQGVAQAQQARPGIQIHWMPGTVHDIPLHRPGALAELIRQFIAALPA